MPFDTVVMPTSHASSQVVLQVVYFDIYCGPIPRLTDILNIFHVRDLFVVRKPMYWQYNLLSKTFFDQVIQTDEIGVAGIGGKALIRGITVTGGANRQDLPPALLCLGQEIHKGPSFLTQGSDAIGRGQGRDRQ